jgi:hypothetical protein
VASAWQTLVEAFQTSQPQQQALQQRTLGMQT